MEIEELQKKYPGILDECWDFAIGPGWLPIVEKLLVAAQEVEKESTSKIHVVQVKEKFGTLRFYYEVSPYAPDNAIKEFDAKVDAAEWESAITCEECGQPGKQTDIGLHRWVRTLCNECDQKNERPHLPSS